MLSLELPIIPFENNSTWDAQAEHFALCLLSSYNDMAFSSRVTDSFKRAYAVDSIDRFPFIVGGRGGYIYCKYNDAIAPKDVIAIEGMRTFSRIVDQWNLSTIARPITGRTGQVLNPFNVYAQTMFTELTNPAGPAWETLVDPVRPLTIAGFSLGAAVAEVLGELLRVRFPNKRIKVAKFASPRVGNTRWIDQRASDILRESVYCNRDPIDVLPFTMPRGSILNASILDPVYFYYQRDAAADRYDFNGEQLEDFHAGGYGDVIRYARSAGQYFLSELDVTNPWFDHQKEAYALMFLELTCRGFNVACARFRYLEFPLWNQFGLAWRPGGFITTDMLTLNGVQPAPVDPHLTQDQIDNANARRGFLGGVDTSATHTGQVDFDNGHSSGTWGDPDPVAPTVPEMRQPVSPVFNPAALGRRRRRVAG